MTQTQSGTGREVDHDKLMSFVFRAVEEVGSALNAALVVMGDQLGYYRALAEHGPSTARELATHTDTDEHYTREWLNCQAAGSYLEYDAETERYMLPPEQMVAFTDASSPAYLPGLFQIAHGTIRDAPRIMAAARAGDGMGWHEHNADVHVGCERFFAPSYQAHLVNEWLPACEGVPEKLSAGGRVADVGCGHGASTILMAQAFPEARFVGSDYHQASIETARERAAEAGVEGQIEFIAEPAQTVDGEGFDLATTFDCLHDMGDPVGAARHIRGLLKDDGTWMIVEPAAGDQVQDNFNPVGRAYYGFSTLLCTPTSLAQDVGLALGTQAGPARIKDVVMAGGFTRFDLVAQTPFNNVFAVRP
ncbi:class I SAM-dependent methyltransferase [Nocardioides sp. Bht2]|uniref:class I SAM-dependent methyltransferase n=1 Tax=Nocardioides sp. Bht2 TaxID=3392297 RepID=UPI0039B43AF4